MEHNLTRFALRGATVSGAFGKVCDDETLFDHDFGLICTEGASDESHFDASRDPLDRI